ncbi:MAG: SAM-dependent chlorinase/fluorinase [Chloroflexota bacterium]|nr:SAM-dependent chlorinase/fluorinase [Chloroflexota bacterium]MDE2908131.1 SAM-dependent chlorinase/fluorinase [Chloroflexota bacterium]
MSNVIALLTDFGLGDIYVGSMKAVIVNICPAAQVIDITHAIKPQNVREAAFALLNSYHYFPAGTIFCVVVDPGVGSDRLAIAVKSEPYYFVGPDNGVLSYALAHLGAEYQAVKLETPAFQAGTISQTFHGRDIFAPAAAHLSQRPAVFASMGGELDKIVRSPMPELRYARQRLIGEVMHIDHFGNIITSIGAFQWMSERELQLTAVWSQGIPPLEFNASAAIITIHSHSVHGISHAYHEAARGGIMAQIDSNGFLEIGANQDDAAGRLDAQLGDKVMLRLS